MLWWTLWQCKSTNPVTRRRAVKKLSAYRTPKVFGHLVAVLSDRDPEMKRLAAEGLSKIGWTFKQNDQRAQQGMALPQWHNPAGLKTVAVAPLIVTLHDEDHAVREQAVEALGALGDLYAVEPLTALLHDSSRAVRRQTAETLGVLGDIQAVGPLVLALRDNDGEVRRQAMETLEKLGWEPQDDRQRALRAVALSQWEEAMALGSVAVTPLVFAFRNGGWVVRQQVIKGLGAIGDARAVDALTEALRDPDRGVRRRSVKALIRIGKGAVDPLIVSLESHDWELRKQAAEVLGAIGDVRAVKPLVIALGDHDIGVRWRAVEALGKMGIRAVEPLVAVLGASDNGVRWWAAAALEKIGVCAVEPLIKSLGDSSRELRQQATEVLGVIGDLRAVEPLVASLGDRDSGVQWRAATGLEKLGWVARDDQQQTLHAQALAIWQEMTSLGRVTEEPLVSVMSDSSRRLPGPAVERLERLGDSHPVP